MQVQDILNNLNIIAEKIFKSVEGEVYKTLDNIVIITPDILKQEPLKNMFFENKLNGIIIIANALILFYIVYYIFTQLISLYNGNKAENVYSFILKIIIVTILVNCSYFICEELLNLFNGLDISVQSFTNNIAGKDVNFQNLKESILSIKDFMKNDFLSLDGIIKGVISFGAVSILINFAIRYVTVIFLILISPFAIVCMANNLTVGIAKNWFKLLITNLLIQIIVRLVILIPIMFKDVNSIMYKIILVGTIYILYRINNFVKEFLVKFTGDKPKRNIFGG